MRLLAFAFLFLFAFLSCGCVGTLAARKHDQLIAAGYPEAYADGYQDGWQSGQQAGGNIYASWCKNVQRAQSDPKYADGWRDGFESGRSQYQSYR